MLGDWVLIALAVFGLWGAWGFVRFVFHISDQAHACAASSAKESSANTERGY